MTLARLLLVLALVLGACMDTPGPTAPDADPGAATATGPPVEGSVTAAADPRDIAVRFRRKASSLQRPVAIASAGDGTKRLFIAEQRGVIKIWTSSRGVRSRPYLDIQGRVQDAGNEEGLLGLAFHPNFKQNRLFFVYFTANDGDNRVVRFRAGKDYRTNTANRDSARRIIEFNHPGESNHNGGQLAFRGQNLFISTGDGGGAGDPDGNAQDLTSLLGKILRINPNDQCGSRRYCNPSGNPFAGGDDPGRGEIYHFGLRNPWRFSFDRANGSMWIADVGQGSREEVNRARAGVLGLNFGWDCREGREPYEPDHAYCDGAEFKDPLFQYGHRGSRCAIVGGHVYRGGKDPEMRGVYLFNDFCSGEVWGVGRAGGQWRRDRVGTAPDSISAWGVRGGRLFAVTLEGGLYRVRARTV